MITLGVDQSLRSMGIAVVDSDVPEPLLLEAFTPKTLRDGQRLAYLANRLTEVLDRYRIDMAAMEGYSYGSSGKVFELGEIGGVVKCLLAQNETTTVIAAPAQVKKFATGKGFGEKEAVQAGILRKWHLNITQDDQADAYVLARIAALYAGGSSKYREELEVIRAIKNPKTTELKARRPSKGVSL